jgi:hypothetical protein
MANAGENFSPIDSSAANFTNEIGDGRVSASLDYYEEAMNGFFTRLKETLSQAGINLPELDLFDSGSSQFGHFGGNSDAGAGQSNQCRQEQEPPVCEAPAPPSQPAPPEQTPPQQCPPDNDTGTGEPNEPSSSRLPFNRKELGGQILLDNFDQVDLDGDGFLRKAEIQDYKRKLDGSLEKASVGKVLDDLKGVKRLSNDQRGEEIGASREDLTALVEKIQRRGELNGYPSI